LAALVTVSLTVELLMIDARGNARGNDVASPWCPGGCRYGWVIPRFARPRAIASGDGSRACSGHAGALACRGIG